LHVAPTARSGIGCHLSVLRQHQAYNPPSSHSTRLGGFVSSSTGYNTPPLAFYRLPHSHRQQLPPPPHSLQTRVGGSFVSFLSTTTVASPSLAPNASWGFVCFVLIDNDRCRPPLAPNASGGFVCLILVDNRRRNPSLTPNASGGVSSFVLVDYSNQHPPVASNASGGFVLSANGQPSPQMRAWGFYL
jgi:hypothetical protein